MVEEKKGKEVGVKIPAFGGKIFVKERPPIAKEVSTD